MEHRSCYKNETHLFIHVIEAITKKNNKYIYTNLWKVNSPNKTERTQEERTKKKKIRINLNTEKQSSLFTLFTSFSHKTSFAH